VNRGMESDNISKFAVTKDSFNEGEYVSSSFPCVVNVDSCFPQKIQGNLDSISNPLFRKNIKHSYCMQQIL